MHAIFIHGTGGNPEEAFFPWTRNALEDLGFKTSAPVLPSALEPDREWWIDTVLDLYVPGEQTVFIGRSLGGTLIPYLLEQDNVSAAAAFSFAAPITHLGWDNLKAFFSAEADFEKAKQSCDHFYHWYSDDDPYVPLEDGQKYQELLGGEFLVFKGYSHFYNEDFPELVEAIQKRFDLSG